MILKARCHRGKRQYSAEWLGYKTDRTWCDACGLKNSPHKLLEFHEANPASSGPPVRLEEWEGCWDGDRDADDHPDANKTPGSHARRGRLRISEPCGYPLRRYSRLLVSTVQRQETME
jgi:hypothetical protein